MTGTAGRSTEQGAPLRRDIPGLAAGAARNDEGAALIMGIAAALILSITAAVVLGITWRQFELFRTRADRAITQAAAMAGLQYAFARLDADSNFRTAVQGKRTNPPLSPNVQVPEDDPKAKYVLVCHTIPGVARDGPLIPALHVSSRMSGGQYQGGKHVTVWVRYLLPIDNPRDPARPYKVGASADY